jgi:hypothetical protein
MILVSLTHAFWVGENKCVAVNRYGSEQDADTTVLRFFRTYNTIFQDIKD